MNAEKTGIQEVSDVFMRLHLAVIKANCLSVAKLKIKVFERLSNYSGFE